MESIKGPETIKSVWLRLGWLAVATFLMILVLFWDSPSSLNPLGRTMLAILIFAMTIWVSGAVGFAESSFYVIAVMGLLVAFTPDPANAHTLLGSRQGIVMALSGFDSDAWLQVTTAFIIASAVKITGLGDRLGLWLISVSGSGPRQMLAGVLLMCYVMELFIPSPTGVAVLMVALLQRVMSICCVERGSGLAKGMMLVVTYGTAVASVGVLTSSAPAIQTAGLIFEATGRDITWLRWLLYGEPFGLALGLVLYIVILLMFPVEKGSFMSPIIGVLLAAPDMNAFVTTFVTVYSGLIPMFATAGNTTDDGIVGVFLNDTFAKYLGLDEIAKVADSIKIKEVSTNA